MVVGRSGQVGVLGQIVGALSEPIGFRDRVVRLLSRQFVVVDGVDRLTVGGA